MIATTDDTNNDNRGYYYGLGVMVSDDPESEEHFATVEKETVKTTINPIYEEFEAVADIDKVVISAGGNSGSMENTETQIPVLKPQKKYNWLVIAIIAVVAIIIIKKIFK